MPSGCREWAITAEGAISPLAGLGSNTSMPCTVLAVARPRRAGPLGGGRGEAVVSGFRPPVVLLPPPPLRIDVNHHPPAGWAGGDKPGGDPPPHPADRR